ncbi:hypothetical protein [Nocardia anaemiae]|uniref:hypothetical protein n=1 Tax=Nocardia anaemiae TaxID=263910 RepID=UPI0007A5418D|nr:hypothetical protein [Nocardia anaemiae]
MRISRITATALLALAATTIGTSVVHAEPAPAAPNSTADVPLDLQGFFQHIGYHVAATQDRHAVVTTISEGRWDLLRGNKVISLTDPDGQVVAALPTAVKIAGHRIDLVPTIDEAGTRLSLTPISTTDDPVRDVSTEQRFFDQVEKSMPQVLTGAAIGAAIGFVLGFPLGLFVFDFITVPVMTVVGGTIGAFAGLSAGGGEPAVQAAMDYFDLNP